MKNFTLTMIGLILVISEAVNGSTICRVSVSSSGSKVDGFVSDQMSSYIGLKIKEEVVRGASHEIEIQSANSDFGLSPGDRIIVYFPNKNKGLDYQIYTNGLEKTRTFKGLKLQEMTDVSELNYGLPGRRVFKLIGKTPTSEESKALRAENERVRALLAAIKTQTDFDQLSAKLKVAIIGIPVSMNNHIKSKEGALSHFNKQEQVFASKMKDWILTNIEMEMDSPGYVPVLNPKFHFTITKDSDGNILGGQVSAIILGVEYSGLDRMNFKSIQEALLAGGKRGDISWQASKYFDYRMNPIAGEDYYVWTGH